jgi:hypothetical protein
MRTMIPTNVTIVQITALLVTNQALKHHVLLVMMDTIFMILHAEQIAQLTTEKTTTLVLVTVSSIFHIFVLNLL